MVLNIPQASGGQRVWILNNLTYPAYVTLVNPTTGGVVEISEDGSLKINDHAHAELHEGNLFRTFYLTTVNINVVTNILLITPNSPFEWHFEGTVSSSGGVEVGLYEGTVTSNNGTGHSVYNANRQSPKANTMNAFIAPTITNVGLQVDGSYIGAGQQLGGVVRSELEWILKPNTKYLLRITSNGNTNRITARLNWYEES